MDGAAAAVVERVVPVALGVAAVDLGQVGFEQVVAVVELVVEPVVPEFGTEAEAEVDSAGVAA